MIELGKERNVHQMTGPRLVQRLRNQHVQSTSPREWVDPVNSRAATARRCRVRVPRRQAASDRLGDQLDAIGLPRNAAEQTGNARIDFLRNYADASDELLGRTGSGARAFGSLNEESAQITAIPECTLLHSHLLLNSGDLIASPLMKIVWVMRRPQM